jgi:hypothetical protein
MIDRVALARSFNWDVAEIYLARDAWRKLYVRQPASNLTFEEYLNMMVSAGLRPSKVGKRKGQFHLARYNDEGAYSIQTCRFVPQEENQKERKEGYQQDPDFRALASKLAFARVRKICPHCGKSAAPGMFGRWHGDKCKERLI